MYDGCASTISLPPIRFVLAKHYFKPTPLIANDISMTPLMLPEPNVIRRENQQELMEPSKNSVPRSTPILRTPPTLYTHVEDVGSARAVTNTDFPLGRNSLATRRSQTPTMIRSGQHRESWFGELPERTPTRDYEVDGFNHMKPVVPYGGALPHSRRPNTNSESAQNRQYSEDPALCEQSSERPTLKPGQLQRAAHVYAPTCNNIYEQAHPRGHLTPPTPTMYELHFDVPYRSPLPQAPSIASDSVLSYTQPNRQKSYDESGGLSTSMSFDDHFNDTTSKSLLRHSSPSSKTKSGRKEIKNSGLKALQGVILPKKYVCTECHKEFRRQGSYRGHLRTHTCFQNFWCEVCGKGFTDLIGKARHNARLTCKAPNPDRRDDGPDPRVSGNFRYLSAIDFEMFTK